MSRFTDLIKIALGEQVATPKIISRVDELWQAIINGDTAPPFIAKTRIELYLSNIIDNTIVIPEPKTRLDKILYAICTSGSIEDIAPLSENEYWLLRYLNEENNINLFDIASVTSFYTWDSSAVYSSTIQDGIITAIAGIYGIDIYCNSNITSLDAGTYKLSADVMLDVDDGLNQIALGFRHDEKTLYDLQYLTAFKAWERKSYTFTLTDTAEIFGFIFQPVGDASNYENIPTKFKNIELIKIS